MDKQENKLKKIGARALHTIFDIRLALVMLTAK
jgi:hypothetical protein